MKLFAELIYLFAKLGANSTSVNKMYDPKVPTQLLEEE